MTTPLPERAGRRCHNVLNSIAAMLYFSPDLGRELAAVGIEDSNGAYFATRAAAMGAVGPGTVTATFYNFRHELIAEHVPAVWQVASPETVLAARTRAVDATLRRLLGEDVIASKELAEAADLALRAAEACGRSARPCTRPTRTCPSPTRRTSRSTTLPPCCVSTAATVTSRRCSTRNSTRSRPW